MISIADLCAKHGTDKGWFHRYGEIYDTLLTRHRPARAAWRVLEIGVQTGASLRVWAEAFPNAWIDGVDIDLGQIDGSLPRNVKLTECDAYASVLPWLQQTYDIIIDDGPHTIESQCEAARLYLPLLAPQGTFIIEDVIDPRWPSLIAAELSQHHLRHAFVIDRAIAPPVVGTADSNRASRLFVVDMC
jgi:SAM-dependent methyltransferase